MGCFDDAFNPSYFEDPDFNFRCLDLGLKIGWNYQSKIIHLAHQTLGKVADKQARFTRSLMRFRKKWGSRMPPMIFQSNLDS